MFRDDFMRYASIGIDDAMPAWLVQWLLANKAILWWMAGLSMALRSPWDLVTVVRYRDVTLAVISRAPWFSRPM